MSDTCGAKTRAGKPCSRVAGYGTTHVGVGRCKNHGGASPQAELGGSVELARREAAVMGRPIDVDPHDALLECIRIAAGEVQYASEQIAKLEAADAVGRQTVVTGKPGLKLGFGEDGLVEEIEAGMVEEYKIDAPALHIWIVARHGAMDRLVNYSKIAIAAGIAERQVRVAEGQGRLLAEVIRGVLEDLGVADRPEVPSIVRRRLTLVAGSGT